MTNKFTSLLSRLRGSKDGRTLTSNFGYLLLLQISTYLFPIITIPYLSRVIGVEGFGKIAFAAAVIVWFKTITDWGFNLTATRDLARYKENAIKVSEIFSNVFWAKCLLGVLSLCILLISILCIPYFNKNKDILLVTFLLVPGNILFPEWFFQGLEKMKFITLFNVISKALFTLMVFIFIREKDDYILQPLFISLGFILSGLVSMYLILNKWNVTLLKPHMPSIITTIKNSSDVFINALMPNLYNSLPVVLLGFWGGEVANGIYSAARKFLDLAVSVMNIMVRASFPFLSRRIEAHDLFTKIVLSTSIVGVLILYFSAPLVIKIFFTSEFEDAVIVLKIASLSLFFSALIRVYGTNYLIIKGHEKKLRNITICSSIAGFILSLPLVYYYTYIGAVITLVLTQAILGIAVTIYSIRLKRIDEKMLYN